VVFAKTASRDSCPIPDAEGCLFRPVTPSVRDGVLTEINSPLWAHGLNILTARGGQWSLLLQHAAARLLLMSCPAEQKNDPEDGEALVDSRIPRLGNNPLRPRLVSCYE
jgi:hypothetical protein